MCYAKIYNLKKIICFIATQWSSSEHVTLFYIIIIIITRWCSFEPRTLCVLLWFSRVRLTVQKYDWNFFNISSNVSNFTIPNHLFSISLIIYYCHHYWAEKMFECMYIDKHITSNDLWGMHTRNEILELSKFIFVETRTRPCICDICVVNIMTNSYNNCWHFNLGNKSWLCNDGEHIVAWLYKSK